jgi:hypothetical protein
MVDSDHESYRLSAAPDLKGGYKNTFRRGPHVMDIQGNTLAWKLQSW